MIIEREQRDLSMTDAEFEEQKERLRALQEKWITPLGLRMWQKVSFEYWREALPPPSDVEPGSKVLARAFPDWRYKTGRILFCLPMCVPLSDEELEYIFLHECVHLLVNEMRYSGDEGGIVHEERCVTEIAMVLGWVRQAGRDDPREEASDGER